VPVNIADLTDRNAVLLAIAECEKLGQPEFLERYRYGPARSYLLHHDGKTYDSKAIAGVAYMYEHPGTTVTSADFSGGEATVARTLRQLGFDVRSGDQPETTPKDELDRRATLWQTILGEPEPNSLPKSRLRELTLYGGAQGIWVDAARTRAIIGAEDHGATVSVLHTGKSYADDLSTDGVIYHYPTTNRPPGRDTAEVEATKTAARLGLPVFVIFPGERTDTRAVAKAWVEDWDDAARLFLIAFQDDAPAPPSDLIDPPDPENFSLLDETSDRRQARRAVRVNQAHFKFRVLKRYGARCAVCQVSVQQLLDAAHLCPKSERGTDDERNGLPLCANHHRALDTYLFGIRPDTLELVPATSGPALHEVGITEANISHLRRPPHRDALQYLWRKFEAT
jgi:putative restriction endonuclease